MWAQAVFIAKCARESWGTPSLKNVTPPLVVTELDKTTWGVIPTTDRPDPKIGVSITHFTLNSELFHFL